jgi:hypothetical protein
MRLYGGAQTKRLAGQQPHPDSALTMNGQSIAFMVSESGCGFFLALR